MNPGLIATLLEALVRTLPVDIVKKGLDALLDMIEDAISKSNTKWDDAVVLPLIAALRAQLGVTENEGSQFEDKPSDAKVDVTVTVKDETK